MKYSKYLMFLFTERKTGGNHPITWQKYDILIGQFEFEVQHSPVFRFEKKFSLYLTFKSGGNASPHEESKHGKMAVARNAFSYSVFEVVYWKFGKRMLNKVAKLLTTTYFTSIVFQDILKN